MTPVNENQALRILVLNPGSTSTKVAYFENEECLWQDQVLYTIDQIASCRDYLDQVEFRQNDLETLIREHDLDVSNLSAIASRGGPFKPLESGTYLVDESVIKDVRNKNVQIDHVSNTGVLIAYDMGHRYGIPAYFVDPISVDEFEPEARISGFPGIDRKSLVHALNIKAVSRKAATELNRNYDALNFVVAHLGGGISICAIKHGRIIDVNNAVEEGPFSPERSGTVPASSLARLCFNGQLPYETVKKRIVGKGGLNGLLGISDLREIENKIRQGDRHAELVVNAMAYQIFKEIGAMAAVLKGRVDGIILTGGVAHAQRVVERIKEHVDFLGRIFVYPGEMEMEALASGVTRVLKGEEKVKSYT